MQLDAESMKGYVKDESILPKEIDSLDMDNIMASFPNEISDYQTEFQEIFQGLVDKAKDCLSYEIEGVKETEKGYVYTVKLTTPDTDELNLDTILKEQMTEEVMGQIIRELLESGAVTDESGEEEIQKAFMPKIIEIVRSAMETVTITPEEQIVDFTVANEDGRWLIVGN